MCLKHIASFPSNYEEKESKLWNIGIRWNGEYQIFF